MTLRAYPERDPAVPHPVAGLLRRRDEGWAGRIGLMDMLSDLGALINVTTVAVTAGATAIATWLGVRNREREKAQEHVNTAQTLLITTLQQTVDAQQQSITRMEGELGDERAKSARMEVRIAELERALLDATVSRTRNRRTTPA